MNPTPEQTEAEMDAAYLLSEQTPDDCDWAYDMWAEDQMEIESE